MKYPPIKPKANHQFIVSKKAKQIIRIFKRRMKAVFLIANNDEIHNPFKALNIILETTSVFEKIVELIIVKLDC